MGCGIVCGKAWAENIEDGGWIPAMELADGNGF